MQSGAICLVAVFLLGGAAMSAAANDSIGGPGLVDVPAVEARARRAGLRVLTGNHLVLVTDRPLRAGDGVEELPAVFDQAFAAWCRHYKIDPAAHADWRAFGCLMVDRERFRAAGLLPDKLPPFENGFCDRNRFWLLDQSNPAYRRHLLLHEGVHAFTLTLRRLATPVWYTEGIAEYLATHRLDPADNGGVEFAPTPIPDRPGDVEQLGRIEKIRELREVGRAPSLASVLALPAGRHGEIADYAASWAAVTLFAQHPAYAAVFTTLEQGVLGPDLNLRLEAMPGWDRARAEQDFDAFTSEIDYGWDFSRMAIDWSPGQPLAGECVVAVNAARGWQNSGLRSAAGERIAFVATGRAGVGTITDTKTGAVTPLETEANGISLEWYRGRPLGRLLVGQWLAGGGAGERPRFAVVADGAGGEFTAPANGPLFVRLNGPPGRLAVGEGAISVRFHSGR